MTLSIRLFGKAILPVVLPLSLAFTTVQSAFAAPDWLREATLGNADIYSGISPGEMDLEIAAQKARNVSVLELDTLLSYYLTDAEFDAEVATIDLASEKAHATGLKTVIYYPAMEVLTQNGVNLSSTMYKDHPEWVQRGINGDANVFYGNQEVWVDANDESAWMSPNTGYLDYFLARIRKLAATDVDGIWVDVPIYLDTGAGWAGAEPAAAADFNAWSIAEGLNNGAGYSVPASPDFTSPAFRAWVHWRHVNLADFIKKIHTAAQEINPDIVLIVENFPMDYMDATKAGLDATVIEPSDNLVSVWELDSVSNTNATQYSNTDDFKNKIAMLKWGKGVLRDNASLSFSYGNQALDAGLTMAAVVASGTAPFEAKTPDMTQSVSSEFRTSWFGFVRDNAQQLLQPQRQARVGIWYSSATRDFQDFPIGGEYGMFSSTTPPTPDPDWWSTATDDRVSRKPHLGGYRGLSTALIDMAIPYKVITDPGDPANELTGIDMLLLPSVAAMSDSVAAHIRNYVQSGGVVLATGSMPGTLTELGDLRSVSVVDDVFDFRQSTTSVRRVNTFGNGLAIYRPDIKGSELFGQTTDATVASKTLSAIEQLVRIHATEDVTLENGDDVYVDLGVSDALNQHLYLVNFSGLQQPLVSAPKDITVRYQAPAGYELVSADAASPDASATIGSVAVTDEGHSIFRMNVRVDQFSLLNLQLAQKTPDTPPAYAGPQFADANQQEAAQSALAFILDSMRKPSLPEPYNFGVHTNLLDNSNSTDVYTDGHHVTAEHMGLLLRTSACMKNETAYDQAYRYIKEAMYSPLYSVANWSIDKFAQRPFVEYNDSLNLWLNANAPLDDLRVIRGLMDGYEKLGREDAEQLANSLLQGLYWTTVTDRDRDNNLDYANYPGGLLGFAWDWSETEDATLDPAAIATGEGVLTMDLIPVDYQELGTIGLAAQRDHRWGAVFASTTQLLLDAEINNSGLFYNGLEQNGTFTGDFEYQGEVQGTHLKTIQVLWTAIHLARASNLDSQYLSAQQKQRARDAAIRSLNFYKGFYAGNNRVPEYMTFAGGDVPDCTNGQPASCLARGETNLFNGEARIYAQLSRLALLLDDNTFANDIIVQKIMTDRIDDVNDARYGLIGESTTGTGDAEAWNVLESALTLCLNAQADEPVDPTDPVDPPGPGGLTSNPAAGITLDGNLADWNNLVSFGVDADDVNAAGNPINWEEAWLAHDGGNLYLAHKNRGSVSSSWGQTIYLDTDDNSATGFANGLPIGADHLVQGQYLYAYNGGANGTVWSWTYVRQLEGSISSNSSEFRIPLDDIGNPGIVRLALVGDNAAFTANGVTDFYPDGIYDSSSTTRFFSYQVSSAGNSAPIAQNISRETLVNIPISITLSATDYDGDALGYTVASQPASGTLSGTAPTLTYTPSNGFAGTDQLTYVANDGVLDSGIATVMITVRTITDNGIASNPADGLVIDGDIDDWATLVSFGSDAAEITGTINPVDYIEAWMAHDATHFYLAHRNDGPELGGIFAWGFNAYIDTDSNAGTGFSNGMGTGSEYLVQGGYLFKYNGNGETWDWTFAGSAERSTSQSAAEVKFSRSAIGDPDNFRVAFIGDNLAIGGSEEDQYPDGVFDSTANRRYFRYSTNGLEASSLEPALLGANLTGETPANGRLSLQQNARQPSSSIQAAVKTGGSVHPLSIVLLLMFYGTVLLRRLDRADT